LNDETSRSLKMPTSTSITNGRAARTLLVKQRRTDMLVQHPTFRFEGTAARRKFMMIKQASSLSAITAAAIAAVVLLATGSATSAQEQIVESPWSNSTAGRHQDQWKNLYNSNDGLNRDLFQSGPPDFCIECTWPEGSPTYQGDNHRVKNNSLSIDINPTIPAEKSNQQIIAETHDETVDRIHRESAQRRKDYCDSHPFLSFRVGCQQDDKQ
jgi:hypothetical protein